MKKVFMFPGQGAQFPGMGKELYESGDKAKKLMESANEILGFRITDTMFNGSDEDLKATEVTQPAVFLHSVTAALCSEGAGIPDMAAGHSLGEFSALTVCGVFGFEDGLRLVAARAAAMQECCASVPGGMAAIIGLPSETVERICGETEGTVVAANYNSDGQVVISGEKDAVRAACESMKAAGAKRALMLEVGGAFHSPLMKPAAEGLARAIDATRFNAPCCPVYQNVSAAPELDPETIKRNLLSQLTSPVRWTQTVQAMLRDGAGEFTEYGPGKVLQGLVKRISAAAGTEVVISGHGNV